VRCDATISRVSKIRLITSSILLLFSAFVCAQEAMELPSTSGNTYLRVCSVVEKDKDRTRDDFRHSILCAAYTRGVVDGVVAEDAFQRMIIGKPPTSPFCTPEAADSEQAIRITLKYIRNNPELAHQTPAVLIIEALREAFPCPAHTAKKP
jgi:hypothetical protein